PYLLIGAGFGLSITPVVIAATSGVARQDAGLASGLLNTSRTVGAAIGLATLSTIAANRTAALLSGGAHVGAALTGGYGRALEVGVSLVIAAMVVAALTIPSLRGAPAMETPAEPQPIVEDETAVEIA